MSNWPHYQGNVLQRGDIGYEEAERLYEETPTEQRLYAAGEVLDMLNSWARPIEDNITVADIDGYVEHMAAGGYVVGEPFKTPAKEPEPPAIPLDYTVAFDGAPEEPTVTDPRLAVLMAQKVKVEHPDSLVTIIVGKEGEPV